jgi:hypothetical protein
MALSKKITLSGNLFLHTDNARYPLGTGSHEMDAYIRVVSVSASKPMAEVMVEITENGTGYQNSYNFQPDLSDGAANHIKQAYEYLKTLPEFADAINV